jgi:hypothetical protein
MSSPRSATAKMSRRTRASAVPAAKVTARPSKPAPKAAPKPAAKPGHAGGSLEAKRLAAEMERALADGRCDLITKDALQALMAALCKTYAAQVEAGEALLPLPQRGGATATDVMLTASGLLKSANLAVFELGMWQSMTGR